MKLNIIFSVNFFFFASLLVMQPATMAREEMPNPVGNLCDYESIEGENIYRFGHVSSFLPEDLTNLINKGRRKIASILSEAEDANIHVLEVFVNYNKHNPYYIKNGITLSNLIDSIKHGVGSTVVDPNLEIQARVETFVSIMWALTSLSWQRGDRFNRGAIILEDKDKRIHDYLQGIVLFCAQVQRLEDLNDGIYTIWGSNIGYQRFGKSSHFVGRQLTHYGFDVRFDPRSFALPVLPFSMTHVLFGRSVTHSGVEVTFIKPEEAGLADLRSLLKHMYCLFAPIPASQLLRREKDVPPDIARGFFELYKLLGGDILKSLDFENTKKYDISWWMVKIEELSRDADTSEDIKTQIENIKNLLMSKYKNNSLRLRSGNEVLFLDEELRQQN